VRRWLPLVCARPGHDSRAATKSCSRGLVRGLLTRIRPPPPLIRTTGLLEQARATGHRSHVGPAFLRADAAPEVRSMASLPGSAHHHPQSMPSPTDPALGTPASGGASRSPSALLPPAGRPLLGPTAAPAGHPRHCSKPAQLH
jgi:hypothetical protein